MLISLKLVQCRLVLFECSCQVKYVCPEPGYMPKPSPPPRKKFRISTTNGKNQNCVGISKEVENSVCSAELIDETTWVIIFAFLPNNYGPVLAGVCKQWRNIVLNNCPMLWTSFSMKLVKGRFPVSIVAAQELLKRAGVLSLRPLGNVISAISKFQALTATSVSVEMFPFFNSMRDSQTEKLLFKLLLCRFPNLSSVSIHGLSCVMQVNMFSETISQVKILHIGSFKLKPLDTHIKGSAFVLHRRISLAE